MPSTFNALVAIALATALISCSKREEPVSTVSDSPEKSEASIEERKREEVKRIAQEKRVDALQRNLKKVEESLAKKEIKFEVSWEQDKKGDTFTVTTLHTYSQSERAFLDEFRRNPSDISLLEAFHLHKNRVKELSEFSKVAGQILELAPDKNLEGRKSLADQAIHEISGRLVAFEEVVKSIEKNQEDRKRLLPEFANKVQEYESELKKQNIFWEPADGTEIKPLADADFESRKNFGRALHQYAKSADSVISEYPPFFSPEAGNPKGIEILLKRRASARTLAKSLWRDAHLDSLVDAWADLDVAGVRIEWFDSGVPAPLLSFSAADGNQAELDVSKVSSVLSSVLEIYKSHDEIIEYPLDAEVVQIRSLLEALASELKVGGLQSADLHALMRKHRISVFRSGAALIDSDLAKLSFSYEKDPDGQLVFREKLLQERLQEEVLKRTTKGFINSVSALLGKSLAWNSLLLKELQSESNPGPDIQMSKKNALILIEKAIDHIGEEFIPDDKFYSEIAPSVHLQERLAKQVLELRKKQKKSE